MSKFLLCSSGIGFSDNVDKSLGHGFSISTRNNNKDYHHVSYNKMNFDSKDCYISDVGKVSLVGSFVYKDQNSERGLKYILDDFLVNKDVSEIKRKMIGNYAITIEVDDGFYCFCDANDIFDVFYSLTDNDWSISNNINDVVTSIEREVIPNKNAILETVVQNGILDNQTIFDAVFRVKGYEYLYFSEGSNCPEVKQHEIISFDFEEQENLDYPKEIIKECSDVAKVISSAYENIAVCMTGGLDSRITLSSYLSVGAKPSLFYGVGNSGLTNTKNRDLDIVNLIKDEFNLDLRIMDWSVGDDVNSSWDNLIEKLGMLGGIYSGISNVHRELSEFKGETLVDFGYFGEPLRNVEALSAFDDDVFTLEQFIDDIYIDKNIKLSISKEEYEEFRIYLFDKAKLICERYGLNIKSLNKNDYCKLHNEYRKSADTALVNLMNYYCYSINLLSLPQVETKVKQIPVKEKANSGLMLKVVNKLNPKLLSLPIFSHCRDCVFCNETYTLKLARDEALKEKLKGLSYKLGISKALRSVYSKIKPNDNESLGRNGKIKQELVAIYNSNSLNVCSMELFEGCDIRKISKYNFLMRMINTNSKR